MEGTREEEEKEKEEGADREREKRLAENLVNKRTTTLLSFVFVAARTHKHTAVCPCGAQSINISVTNNSLAHRHRPRDLIADPGHFFCPLEETTKKKKIDGIENK